ncbi:MAG: GNAT family N-acetyltransferase [Alphaproteobacteria bacterium]|nr:GNAT family N-acetyltransferase [Alphaproteobacteria bacterium]NDC56490.1 GNAT family N-acetyltransferase [Alphaproteobacteria bacterium]NDG05215.1 GNAT family N-acetyltransferase [Alphaproteobacteria bacterium]
MHKYESFEIFDGDKRVGYVHYQPRSHAFGTLESPVMYVEGFWVDPAYRQQGVGRQLMEKLIDHAKNMGFLAIASDTEPENDASAAAHTACGFRDAGLLRHFVFEFKN